MMLNLPWSAIHTRYQYEERVSADLGRLGVELYYPSFVEHMRYRNRLRADITRPLFAGYTFSRFDPKDAFTRERIMRLIGCLQLLPGVSETELEAVRRMIASNLGVRPEVAGLVQGDRVRVARGPLEGLEGIFVRRRKPEDPGRFVVSLELLGRACSVPMLASDILVLPKHKTARIAASCLTSANHG